MFRILFKMLAVVALSIIAWGAAGCLPPVYIPGTRVTDSKINRELIELCEKYRHALEDRDAETLLQLASPNYFEDSGTPKADDDYGYEGLKQVINLRLAALKSLRYDMQYRNIIVEGKHAAVDVRYDASYQIATELGDRWERKQNEKRLELLYENNKWLFVGGF